MKRCPLSIVALLFLAFGPVGMDAKAGPGPCPCVSNADVNDDGVIDPADIVIVLDCFKAVPFTPPPPNSVRAVNRTTGDGKRPILQSRVRDGCGDQLDHPKECRGRHQGPFVRIGPNVIKSAVGQRLVAGPKRRIIAPYPRTGLLERLARSVDRLSMPHNPRSSRQITWCLLRADAAAG